jgi:hypothetical protein
MRRPDRELAQRPAGIERRPNSVVCSHDVLFTHSSDLMLRVGSSCPLPNATLRTHDSAAKAPQSITSSARTSSEDTSKRYCSAAVLRLIISSMELGTLATDNIVRHSSCTCPSCGRRDAQGRRRRDRDPLVSSLVEAVAQHVMAAEKLHADGYAGASQCRPHKPLILLAGQKWPLAATETFVLAR